MSELWQMDLRGLRDALKRRDVTFVEVADSFLKRALETDTRLGSFLYLHEEQVRADAAALDAQRDGRQLKMGFLTGMPIGLKDNIVTRGIPTTAGSKILNGYRAPYDATVVRRLRREQSLLIGKTNCDEFAMGSSTENSAYQPTRNPWDLERVPGGSSGGSAAAVAAGQLVAALGSDTGGSIRQPAAFCGIVGLKPTYGRVSRYGLVAFASSLDQIGPLTRTVRDAATVLQVIAGHDEADSTSSAHPVDNYVSGLNADPRGTRVGVPADWFDEGLDPEVETLVRAAVARLESLGCEVREVRLPYSKYAIATYYVVAPAEASSNLARYDGVRYGHRAADPADLADMYRRSRSEGFGREVKRRILIGTYVLSAGYYEAYFQKAARVRALIQEDFRKAFEKVDVIAGPTTPTPPFQLGSRTDDPLAMYLSDVYTTTANLAGVPALSMPCGFTDANLPVGLQLVAPHFEEARLLAVAHALEQDLALERPPLAV